MTSTRFFSFPRARRRGQALILAVLVMLFAALLSSAFLVLVASNGRQIGRETDRQEASRNADDAIDKVKGWINASPNADAWSPLNDSNVTSTAPPTAASTDYDFYWSPLDRAMGWDDPAQGFVKYPDPRNPKKVPQFLVSSHLIGSGEPMSFPGQDNFADGGDKRFMLRITIIGLSLKNPGSWSRRTLYKPTNWNGSTFAYGNVVTATDPLSGKKLATTLNTNTAIGATVDSKGLFTVPFNTPTDTANPMQIGNTIMLSDGQTAPTVGIVQAVSSTNATLRRVHSDSSTSTSVNFAQGAVVNAQLVGSLFETPPSIDENGTQPIPAGTTIPQSVSGVRTDGTDTNVQPLGGGAYFNNGLSVPITTTFGARPPVGTANMNAFNGASTAYSGQNALISTGPVTIGAAIGSTEGIQVKDVGPSPQPTAIFNEKGASDNQYLRIGYTPTGVISADTYTNSTDPQADLDRPKFLQPAPLTLSFYKAAAVASSSYIDNIGDKEKFGGITPPADYELTTGQLQRFWQRKSFVPTATQGNGNAAIFPAGSPVTAPITAGTATARLCYGRPGTDSYLYPNSGGASLEEKGIRGWISPWEFLPRGAQVILNGTTATIIRDPLSDTSADKPDPAKAVDATIRRYSQIFTPPSTNVAPVICADGNLRVSGNWTGNPLTIVSGNNIYIEGSLKADAGKIALLAKKNVVLNPTQFVARPEGTVDTSVGKTAFTAQVQLGEVKQAAGKSFTANSFKFGDKVAVFKQGMKADGWHQVTGFDDPVTPTSIKLMPPLNTTDFPDGAEIKVKLACDPPIVLLRAANKTNGAGANDIPATEHFIAGGDGKEANLEELDPATNAANVGAYYAYKFAVGGDTLARKVPFNDKSGATVPVAVAFDHAAQKKRG